MSDVVYPSASILPSQAYPRPKTPIWGTVITHRAASGREVRVGLQTYPLYRFVLNYEALSSEASVAELQNIMDFFNARNASLDNFLYNDPNDNIVSDHQFGIGDAAETEFQLTRAMKTSGFLEPVMNVNILTNIKVAGVTKSSPGDYSIDSYGLVTFTSPPAGAASLTWSGTYYFRCRFEKDEQEFEEFVHDLWTLKKVALIGSLGRKI